MPTPPAVIVHVDVVSPGKGLVTCADVDFSGTIIRDRASSRGYLVETEVGDIVGKARTYRDAAIRLAKHHGVPAQSVHVEINFEEN